MPINWHNPFKGRQRTLEKRSFCACAGISGILCLAEIVFTARTGLPSQMEITSWMPRVPCNVEIHGSAMTVGEQGSSLVPLDGEIGFLWIDSSPRAASFRQRAGHIGGEVHRLAEWRRPLRTPAVARIVFPADCAYRKLRTG